MLSQLKWVRTGLAVLMVLALLSGGLAWAKKPVPPPDPEPEPDPPPVTYMITWLDAFESNYAWCINSDGHVGGLAESPDKYGGEPFAFVYTPATGMVDLNTLLPVPNDWHLRNANAINDKGQIVGLGYRTGSDKGRGWLYTPALLDENGEELLPAVIEELAPPSADDQKTIASKINEDGEVLGRTIDANGVSHAWLFMDGLTVAVFSPTVGTTASTRELNESGQILIDTDSAAVRISPLGVPEYFYDVWDVWAMNDNGFFVGRKDFDVEVPINKKRTEIRTVSRAVRHDGVAALDLGAGDNSYAYGINNNGDVTGGRYALNSNMLRGFVYLEEFEQVVELDTAVVGDEIDILRWNELGSIQYPRIHDTGQIVSHAPNPYPLLGMSGFILTPVPTAPPEE